MNCIPERLLEFETSHATSFRCLLGVGGNGVGLYHYQAHQSVRVAVYDVSLKLVLERVPALVGVGMEDTGVQCLRSPSRRS